MKGITLYILTFFIEQISVASRFLLVAGACGLFLPHNVALAAGATIALAPLTYSLLVLCGLPSGHIMARRALHGRSPDDDEAQHLRATLDALPGNDGTRPRHVFVIDEGAVNACVAGTALYAYAGLMETKYLGAVLAHELGHLRSADGRLSTALRALVVPGAFWLSGALHGLVILVRRGLVWLIAGLVGLLGLFWLVGLLRVLITVFLVYVPHYAIIFAMGGVGPRLIDFAWQGYFIEREFGADAYAAARGQRLLLVELLLRFQATLADVTIPWSSRRTHPPLRQRIARLRATAPPAEQRQIDALLRRFGFDLAEPRPPAERPAGRWPIALCALLLLALLAYGAFAWLDAPPRLPRRSPAATPTMGPTPTLGFGA